MSRPITLFTGQWADLSLDALAEMAAGWGYDGLELGCWGDHFEVDKALSDDGYCQSRQDILAKHGLKVWAISNHLVGQAVCDVIDERHKAILPPRVWGDGKGEKVQERAAQEMIDTAKAAAHQAGIKMVTCPTIASNDSPTSSFTVWYDEEGNCTGFESWGRNPDLVLVDTQVIAEGPVEAFVAGMGDALGTWVEAEACHKARAMNLAGGAATMAAMAIARLCYDVLMAHGADAKRAVEKHVVTPAVEKVVEANVLLSGLGFESGGVATAHMIANCLPSFPECHHLMHGHEVGFGVISQLCLDEDVSAAERNAIVDFEIAVGLPVTFADLGLEGVARDRLKTIGDICASEGSLCENHPFEVTSASVIDAIIAADALGRERKKLADVC